jgi:hypothetical protein
MIYISKISSDNHLNIIIIIIDNHNQYSSNGIQ